MIEHRLRRPSRTTNDGFTLIELLVVVVILGILSAVVVFAVRGAGDKGKEAAVATDERTIRTAQEAYCAKAGRYATEMGQLTGDLPVSDTDPTKYKFLSEPSQYHDLEPGPPACGGKPGFKIVSKDGSPMPGCGATTPGGHPPVNPEAVCPQPNGWCVDDATPGGTPQWDQTTLSMVQLRNGKVFAVYQDADRDPSTCGNVFTCTYTGKSGVFNPTAAPNLRWTPGPTVTGSNTGGTPYSLNSMLVIEGTAEQCGDRCGQVLADLVGWKLYDPTKNTWTPTPPSLAGGRTSRAVQLTGSKDQCGDRCGQVLTVVGDTRFDRTAFYDPKNNIWTPGPNLDGIEDFPVVALLQDGRVLVMGCPCSSGEPAAKLFDPRESSPGRMVRDAAKPNGRYGGGFPARLPDGRILFTSGTTEIYSPEPDGPGSWAPAEKCVEAAHSHTFTFDHKEACQVVAQLSDGRVLARASDASQPNTTVPSAMFLFYPDDGHWHPTGTPTTRAPDGIGVLVAAGPGRECGDYCNKVLTVGRRAFPAGDPVKAEFYMPPPP